MKENASNLPQTNRVVPISFDSLDWAIVATNATFIGMIVIFSTHSRFAVDDFCIVETVQRLGFWSAQRDWYTTWIGRWSAIMNASFFGTLAITTARSTWINIADFLINWCSLVYLFRICSERWRLTQIDFNRQLNLAGLALNILFLATPNASQSWFWMSGSVCYSWPLAAVFLMAAYFIDARPLGARTPILVMTAAFISGANETLAGFVLLILIGTLIFAHFIAHDRTLTRKVVWAFAAGMASFIVVALSPGNTVRTVELAKLPFVHRQALMPAILKSFSEAWVVLGLFQRHKLAWALLAVAVAIYYFRPKTLSSNFVRDHPLPTFALTILMIIVGNAILVFPGVILTGYSPPDRSWITNSLWTVSVAVIGGVMIFSSDRILGLHRRFRHLGQMGKVLFIVAMLGMAGFELRYTLKRWSDVARYSDAYDRSYRRIADELRKGRKEPLIVEDLPFTNEYYSVQHLADACLEKMLRLPFSLTRKAASTNYRQKDALLPLLTQR